MYTCEHVFEFFLVDIRLHFIKFRYRCTFCFSVFIFVVFTRTNFRRIVCKETLLSVQLKELLGTSAIKKENTYLKVAETGVAKVTGWSLGVASWTLTSNSFVSSGIVSVAI